jgi:hypothetical protein
MCNVGLLQLAECSSMLQHAATAPVHGRVTFEAQLACLPACLLQGTSVSTHRAPMARDHLSSHAGSAVLHIIIYAPNSLLAYEVVAQSAAPAAGAGEGSSSDVNHVELRTMGEQQRGSVMLQL